jgi:hypothetical protein
MRACLHPQPAFRVVAFLVVKIQGIVVRGARPDLAGHEVDPAAAGHRVAVQQRSQLLEVDGDRPQSARRALERVGELGVAVEPAATQTFGALTRERAVATVQQRVAHELEHVLERASAARAVDRRQVPPPQGGPQLLQRIAVPLG